MGLLGDREDRARWLGEFSRFASCFDMGDPMLAHKRSHTLEVARDAGLIAERVAAGGERVVGSCADASVDVIVSTPVGIPSLPDADACYLAGLLHDVGRFPQYAMYRTYSDAATFPHAALSHRMLVEFGMLGRFVDAEMLDDGGRRLLGCVTEAVRRHSDLSVDDIDDPLVRVHCDVLRDADQIAILSAFLHAVSSDGFAGLVADAAAALGGDGPMPAVDPIAMPTVVALARRLGAGVAVSECVMADIGAGRMVDRRGVCTFGDAIVSVAALSCGVSTDAGRSLLAERGVMVGIADAVLGMYGGEDGDGSFGHAMGLLVCG